MRTHNFVSNLVHRWPYMLLLQTSLIHLLRLARPNSVGDTPHELQLLAHIFVAQRVALRVRCKTTLRADTALLDGVLSRLTSALRNPVCSLVDTRDHIVLVLQLRELRCDHTQDHVLVLGKVRKRLEATSTRCVVLEVVSVDVEVLHRLAMIFCLNH